MKEVASFRESHQAHILKGALESEGIPATLLDEQLASINWIYSQAIGGVKVNVPDEYYEKAVQFIRNINDEELEDNFAKPKNETVDVCPKCGSDILEPTKFSKWSLVPSLMFLFPLFWGKKTWQCKACGYKLKQQLGLLSGWGVQSLQTMARMFQNIAENFHNNKLLCERENKQCWMVSISS